MIVLDLSILNQKGTPMFNSDTFANRPAFGIVGRIFISTDTKEFFRDTGTSWELIGGPGSGTITGSGAATQVAFWNGASTITGSNNLWYDITNSYLGVNTNAPGNPLDVHGNLSSVAALNQTTATNNTLLSLLNSGTPLWRIGNFYTAGANDFGIFDVVNTLQQLTIVKATGQTFIGAKTNASGRLVVNSATADAHLQIVGANAPSIRIDNAGSGGTQRFVIGNATATNNFIQGSAAGNFCITTASASPLLFGMWQTTNASEVMRITTSNNLLIGLSVDGGQRLQVSGGARATGYYLDGMTAGNGALYWSSDRVTLANYNVGGILNFEVNGGTSAANINASGNFGLGVTPSAWYTPFGTKAIQFAASGSIYGLDVSSSDRRAGLMNNSFINSSGNYTYINTGASTQYEQSGGAHAWYNAASGTAGNLITFTQAMTLNASGNLLIGTTTNSGEKVIINGTLKVINANILLSNNWALTARNFADTLNLTLISRNTSDRVIIDPDGYGTNIGGGGTVIINGAGGNVLIGTTTNGASVLRIVGLPTSPVGLSSGDVYSNAGILTIVP